MGLHLRAEMFTCLMGLHLRDLGLYWPHGRQESGTATRSATPILGWALHRPHSTSGLPIEYASISLVNIRSDEVVTGALTSKTGRFNIREVPLGRYRAVVEFIGYATKEISPINIFPGEGGGIEQNIGNIQLQI